MGKGLWVIVHNGYKNWKLYLYWIFI